MATHTEPRHKAPHEESLIDRALLRHRTFILEWFLALEAMFLGVYILLPGATFTRATALADVPEWLTGLLFILHGSVGVWILLAENQRGVTRSQRNLDFCRRSALASAGFWSAITLSYVIAPPAFTSLAVPTTFSFVLASIWVYFRLYMRFKR